MSTRSVIAMQDSDGTIRSIYCHFDGYPSGVGETLTTHYTDPKKIDKLLDLGDISVLGEKVAPESNEVQTFDNPSKGVTIAYMRDRGEMKCEATIEHSFNQLRGVAYGCGAEYVYLFNKSKWETFTL